MPGWLVETVDWLQIACEIGILAFLLYSALQFVRGTRAETVLLGITIVMIAMGFFSRLLGLEVIDWILMQTWTFLALSILVIFQPEIRRAFAQIGSQQSRLRLDTGTKRHREAIEALLEATYFLAERHIGALIALERDIGMRAFADTGSPVNAPLSAKLLTTLFYPNTPLHDGAAIVRGNTIAAAGCIFPLTQSPELSKYLGTRHRAGVGVTEETDAVAIIVSEETGMVSLAHLGRLVTGVSRERLQRHLTNYLIRKRDRKPAATVRAGITDLETGLTEETHHDAAGDA